MLLRLGLPHNMSAQWMRTGVVVSHVCLWRPGRPKVRLDIDGLVLPWTLLLIFGLRYTGSP